MSSIFPWGKLTKITKAEINMRSFDLNDYFGLCQAVVLPNANLPLGLLPLHHNSTLIFPLCAACIDCKQLFCTHSDAERALKSVWTTVELSFALEHGYRLLDVFEVRFFTIKIKSTVIKNKINLQIWHFKKTTSNLFTEYYKVFGSLKIHSSHPPAPDHTQEYVRKFRDNFGIEVIPENIQFDNTKRTIAKLMVRLHFL